MSSDGEDVYDIFGLEDEFVLEIRYVVIFFIVKDILDLYKFNVLRWRLSESDLDSESFSRGELRNNLLWYLWMVVIRFKCL